MTFKSPRCIRAVVCNVLCRATCYVMSACCMDVRCASFDYCCCFGFLCVFNPRYVVRCVDILIRYTIPPLDEVKSCFHLRRLVLPCLMISLLVYFLFLMLLSYRCVLLFRMVHHKVLHD